MASSCQAVLDDIENAATYDKSSSLAAAIYLQSLILAHNEGLEIQERFRLNGSPRIQPSTTGEHKMARKLGVMDNYRQWQRTRVTRPER